MSRSWSEGTLEASDGVRLAYRSCLSKPVKPLLLIIHGFGEHCGRYGAFVNHLGDLSVDFAMMDLRGHGQSGGGRVSVSGYDEYVEDIRCFLDYLKGHHDVPIERIQIYGHSLGAAIACCFALKYPSCVQKLILSSPCILPRLWIPFGGAAVRSLAFLWPRFMIRNPVKPIFLSHDPEEVKEYGRDPLIQRRITFALLKAMVEGGRMLCVRAHEILISVAVLSGERELIVNKRAAKRFYNRIGTLRKEWIEFKGFYHDIFREKGREKCFDALREIIERT